MASKHFSIVQKRSQRMTVGYGLRSVAANIVVWLGVLVSLYPIVLMGLNAFKSSAEINLNPAGLPHNWTFSNYGTILSQFLLNFFNAILVATVTTIVSVFLAALAAFAFAKYRFWGRNILFALLLATILIPAEITIAPQYLLAAQLGWLNTYQVQIVPYMVSVFGMFMIRQYMITIPTSLIEAAKLDGASDWRVFWRIAVPTAAPVLSAFAILQFLAMWNNYLWPSVVANDPSVASIMVILPTLRDPNLGFLPIWGPIMAGCVLTTLPILIVFLVFQRRFIDGVVVGAIRE